MKTEDVAFTAHRADSLIVYSQYGNSLPLGWLVVLVPAPPGMGRQRPQNTQEDRGWYGDGRGCDPQHLPHIGLYTPATRYLLATRVSVRYLVVCYSQVGALGIYRSAIPWHNDRMASRSFIFRRFLCAICEILWPEKLRSRNTHRERTLLSATTSDLLLRLKMRLWRDYVKYLIPVWCVHGAWADPHHSLILCEWFQTYLKLYLAKLLPQQYWVLSACYLG